MSEEKDVLITYAAARINNGYTQMEAARHLEINVKTLCNYENGITVPNWETHRRMSEFYNIPEQMLCSPKRQNFNLHKESH